MFTAFALLASAHGPQPLRMIVPLYVEPGPVWQRLARSARANPSVSISAIISPRHWDNAAPMAGDDIFAIAHNQTLDELNFFCREQRLPLDMQQRLTSRRARAAVEFARRRPRGRARPLRHIA